MAEAEDQAAEPDDTPAAEAAGGAGAGTPAADDAGPDDAGVDDAGPDDAGLDEAGAEGSGDAAEAAPPDGEDGVRGGRGEELFAAEALLDALRQARVGELLLSTVTTLASVAYGKLEARDLPEARAAIDAIGALVPLLAGQIDAAIQRDLEQALANLRLAYADAVGAAQ